MEGKMGRFIHRVEDMLVPIQHMREKGRLDSEKRNAARELQQMTQRFGGLSGREVTIDQIKEYLAVKLRSTRADYEVFDFRYPGYYPQWSSIEGLGKVQDLQAPGGLEEAIKFFGETKVQALSLAVMLAKSNTLDKETRVGEYYRQAIACDEAARILAL